ncbi:MAG: Flp pilus assembly protein CpaB [Oscillochloridaceae bacterium umkhey_bin13]
MRSRIRYHRKGRRNSYHTKRSNRLALCCAATMMNWGESMSRQRAWIVLALGFVLAIGTGTGLWYVLRAQEQVMNERAEAIAQAASVAIPVQTMPIPVAARPLSAGTMLTPDDLLIKEFPLELVPPSAITIEMSLANQVIIEPIAQGETFTAARLAGEQAARMSQRLTAGQMLFAFPVADLLSQANVVGDGDRIDLLLTLTLNEADGALPGQLTMFTLQNIDVLKVLRPAGAAENAPPVALLLGVSPEQAVLIKHVKDTGGLIDLVLRSPLDREDFVVPPVNKSDLIARFGAR